MKSVLITGAYGGMGQATAKLLAQKGFRVFALDLKTGEAQENIMPIQADITDGASVLAAFQSVSQKTDDLYAILHFAGVYMLDSLVEMDETSFERIFKINVEGVYRVNKTFLPLLKQGSRILITTSELANLDPLPFTGIYAVTKAALDKYAYSLRMELQLLGISVSVLRAGAVDTGMLGVSTSALERFCSSTALYTCNAKRFRSIVGRVEARNIPTVKIAGKVYGIIKKKSPGFAYSINRNPLLILLNILPRCIQFAIIKMILQN